MIYIKKYAECTSGFIEDMKNMFRDGWYSEFRHVMKGERKYQMEKLFGTAEPNITIHEEVLLKSTDQGHFEIYLSYTENSL